MMWSQLSFQDSASPIMTALTSFHDEAMISVILIMAYVGFTMTALLNLPQSVAVPYEDHELETLWTIMPAIILITLALPSLRLLYLLDEVSNPVLTMKTVGHQWYWSYEYADFLGLEFDSYMTPTEELQMGDFRLLEVDNRIVLPWGVETRVLVTAADVLHAWTIPSMGVKADAIPGRLNQLSILPTRPGVFYGQCSEICGANHSFMPIALETINPHMWTTWVKTMLERL